MEQGPVLAGLFSNTADLAGNRTPDPWTSYRASDAHRPSLHPPFPGLSLSFFSFSLFFSVSWCRLQSATVWHFPSPLCRDTVHSPREYRLTGDAGRSAQTGFRGGQTAKNCRAMSAPSCVNKVSRYTVLHSPHLPICIESALPLGPPAEHPLPQCCLLSTHRVAVVVVSSGPARGNLRTFCSGVATVSFSWCFFLRNAPGPSRSRPEWDSARSVKNHPAPADDP